MSTLQGGFRPWARPQLSIIQAKRVSQVVEVHGFLSAISRSSRDTAVIQTQPGARVACSDPITTTGRIKLGLWICTLLD